jgi:hypothetical protein
MRLVADGHIDLQSLRWLRMAGGRDEPCVQAQQ